MSRGPRLLVLLALGACAGESRAPDDSAGVAAPAPATSQPPAASGPTACPATGRWAECSVVERLDRAGLAPRIDSAGASEAPLAPRGALVRVGSAELELYIYPDTPARERDQAKLARGTFLAHDAPIAIRVQPTLIPSANLIAILHSRNDHQRERVADALTAGPPQPPRP